jgi:peptide/nickel transport system permease protein
MKKRDTDEKTAPQRTSAQITIPDWSAMLGSVRYQVFTAPHLVLLPGIAILIMDLAYNFLGDGLLDALDPRLSQQESW